MSLRFQAISSSNIGTMLDEITFYIAFCRRVHAICVFAHHFPCGEAVDSLKYHAVGAQAEFLVMLNLITPFVMFLSQPCLGKWIDI